MAQFRSVGSSRKPLVARCAALLALTAPAVSQAFSGEFPASRRGTGELGGLCALAGFRRSRMH